MPLLRDGHTLSDLQMEQVGPSHPSLHKVEDPALLQVSGTVKLRISSINMAWTSSIWTWSWVGARREPQVSFAQRDKEPHPVWQVQVPLLQIPRLPQVVFPTPQIAAAVEEFKEKEAVVKSDIVKRKSFNSAADFRKMVGFVIFGVVLLLGQP